jgi:hypothetical protein
MFVTSVYFSMQVKQHDGIANVCVFILELGMVTTSRDVAGQAAANLEVKAAACFGLVTACLVVDSIIEKRTPIGLDSASPIFLKP